MSQPNSGWTNPINLNVLLPAAQPGKLVTFIALRQAALTQYVQITDSQGNPISFTTLDGRSAQFPIQGTGTSVGFFDNGSGQFRLQEGMQLMFGNSGSKTSQTAYANPSTFVIAGQTYGGGAMVVTEDEGGTDYNDTTLNLQWYQYEG